MKSQGLALYLVTIFLAAIAVVLFVGYQQAVASNSPEQNALLICFMIAAFSLTMTIQAAIIRWGSRANDVVAGLEKLESLMSVMIAGSGYNRCDACRQVVEPTELTVISIGKTVCENCREKLET